VDWVSGKGEVFVLWYHKENITQVWVRVKGELYKRD
jgi:hypothetical protein